MLGHGGQFPLDIPIYPPQIHFQAFLHPAIPFQLLGLGIPTMLYKRLGRQARKALPQDQASLLGPSHQGPQPFQRPPRLCRKSHRLGLHRCIRTHPLQVGGLNRLDLKPYTSSVAGAIHSRPPPNVAESASSATDQSAGYVENSLSPQKYCQYRFSTH